MNVLLNRMVFEFPVAFDKKFKKFLNLKFCQIWVMAELQTHFVVLVPETQVKFTYMVIKTELDIVNIVDLRVLLLSHPAFRPHFHIYKKQLIEPYHEHGCENSSGRRWHCRSSRGWNLSVL